jgi:hypothetical protein
MSLNHGSERLEESSGTETGRGSCRNQGPAAQGKIRSMQGRKGKLIALDVRDVIGLTVGRGDASL